MVFIENLLPFSMIESSSFQDFVESCLPGKKTMSRRTLTRRIENQSVVLTHIEHFVFELLCS